LKKWKEIIESELPEPVNLSNVTKFCTTSKFLLLETAPQWTEPELPSDWKGDSVWHGEPDIADYVCNNDRRGSTSRGIQYKL